MSRDAGQSANSLHQMKLPPLIPIGYTEPRKDDQNVSKRKTSEFSIDCILSKKHTEERKPIEKLINRVESSSQTNTYLKPKFGNAIDSKVPENSKIPSYTCMIAQAILGSRDRKITLGEIYEYIEREYPTIEDKVKGWRNCVRHNLSLNECFLKIGPSGHGRGNNWTVHPSYVENFLRGHFRKRMASRRRKAQIVDMSSWQEGQLNGTELFTGPMLPYQQSSIPEKYLKLVTHGITSESHWQQCFMNKPSTTHTFLPFKHCCPSTCGNFGNPQNFPNSASEQYQMANHSQTFCFNNKRPQGIIHPSFIHKGGHTNKINVRAYQYEDICNKAKGSLSSVIGSIAGGEDSDNVYMQKNFLIHFPADKIGTVESRFVSRPNCTQQKITNHMVYP